MRPVLVRFGGILFVVALAIWLYCLLDAITTDRDRVRTLPKGVWIAIVLLLFEIGAIAWLIAGRPRGPAPDAPGTDSRGPGGGLPGRMTWPSNGSAGRRPGGRPAPDDDPDFLAELDRQAAQDHERLLGSWEEDLRRREEELKREQKADEDPDAGPEPPVSR